MYTNNTNSSSNLFVTTMNSNTHTDHGDVSEATTSSTATTSEPYPYCNLPPAFCVSTAMIVGDKYVSAGGTFSEETSLSSAIHSDHTQSTLSCGIIGAEGDANPTASIQDFDNNNATNATTTTLPGVNLPMQQLLGRAHYKTIRADSIELRVLRANASQQLEHVAQLWRVDRHCWSGTCTVYMQPAQHRTLHDVLFAPASNATNLNYNNNNIERLTTVFSALPRSQVRATCAGVVRALEWLHNRQHVAHMTIRLEHILLDQRVGARLCGLSRARDVTSTPTAPSWTTRKARKRHAAPIDNNSTAIAQPTLTSELPLTTGITVASPPCSAIDLQYLSPELLTACILWPAQSTALDNNLWTLPIAHKRSRLDNNNNKTDDWKTSINPTSPIVSSTAKMDLDFRQCDIYALGVCMHAAAHGRWPYTPISDARENAKAKRQLRRYKHCHVPSDNQQSSNHQQQTDNPLDKILSRMLCVNGQLRATAGQLKHDEWLNKVEPSTECFMPRLRTTTANRK